MVSAVEITVASKRLAYWMSASRSSCCVMRPDARLSPVTTPVTNRPPGSEEQALASASSRSAIAKESARMAQIGMIPRRGVPVP